MSGTPKKTNLDKVREINYEGQAKKVGRFLIDIQTANAILLIYNSLGEVNRDKYTKIINSDLPKAARMAWKLVH
jgi:hypothetical protein